MLARDTDPITTARSRLDYHATVRELPSQERPRERLQHFGPQALSAVELLAIILRPARAGITPWTWLTACSSSMAVWPGWCGPTSTNYALSAVWARPSQRRSRRPSNWGVGWHCYRRTLGTASARPRMPLTW